MNLRMNHVATSKIMFFSVVFYKQQSLISNHSGENLVHMSRHFYGKMVTLYLPLWQTIMVVTLLVTCIEG